MRGQGASRENGVAKKGGLLHGKKRGGRTRWKGVVGGGSYARKNT